MVHAIDQFSQHVRGPHLYSRSTNPDDCVALNLAEFERNLHRYGVANGIKVWPGTTDQIAKQFPRDVKADVLCIDVDGHIDRDLGYFYDFIEPGGWIIVDDYADHIDRNGRKRLAMMSGKPEAEIRQWLSQQDRYTARLLLGKHILTFYLANHFENAGALRKEYILGTTAFYRNTGNRPFAGFSLSGIAEIEGRLKERYVTEAISGAWI